MQRKIAFCVGYWAADSTLYSWTYAKQYFLRKQRDENGQETLSELDKLYIVHVNSGKPKERWNAGGPILPGLSVALANYPHTVVELEGNNTASAILDFAVKEDIDILILGSKEHKGAVQKIVPGASTLGSTSDNVKARCKCPCLIIRPGSARNEKMRIKSMVNMAHLMEGQDIRKTGSTGLSRQMTVPLTAPEPRRVAIAFEHAEAGSNMTAWAAKACLFPDDEIFLVHITNRQQPLQGLAERMQKSTSFQKAAGKLKIQESLKKEDCESVGQDELQGYDVVAFNRLKGDAKAELVEFLEQEGVDLLIVGFSASSRFRKALAGGSLSSHMLHHAPCPVVVLPLKSMAWEDSDTLSSLPELRPSLSSGAELPSAVALDSDGMSTSPPHHQLGPRVSMSRSLSHHLSLSRDTLLSASRPSVGEDAAFSPPASGPASPTGYPPPRAYSEGGQTSPPAHLQGSGGSLGSAQYASLLPMQQPVTVQMTAPPKSAFQEAAAAEKLRSEGIQGQRSSPPSAGGSESAAMSEVEELRRQLEAKDEENRSLKEQVRQLTFQLAAVKGSSSSRVLLPA